MTFLNKPSVKVDANHNAKTIFRTRKPFIRPTNWLFRLITWITVSKTSSFLSKSCRVCEKCQLKQSTGTGNVFADILTANPNIIAYTQFCSDYIGYALFPQTNAAHFCCTPQWHRVLYEVIWFRLICSDRKWIPLYSPSWFISFNRLRNFYPWQLN